MMDNMIVMLTHHRHKPTDLVNFTMLRDPPKNIVLRKDELSDKLYGIYMCPIKNEYQEC
jgi:hypothetical protein